MSILSVISVSCFRPRSHCSVFVMMRFCCMKVPVHINPFLYKNGGKNVRFCALRLIKCVFKNLCFCGYQLLIALSKTFFCCFFVRISVNIFTKRFSLRFCTKTDHGEWGRREYFLAKSVQRIFASKNLPLLGALEYI